MAPHFREAKMMVPSNVPGFVNHCALTKSSVFDSRAPSKRFQRSLSHSKVGMSGNSPFYPHIRKFSPSRERRSRNAVEEAVKGEDVRHLWKHYMDLENKPLSNRELKQLGHRLATLLVNDLTSASDSQDQEALKKAVAAADGKLQIINLGGLRELKVAKKALNIHPESLPDPYAIAGNVSAKAPAESSGKNQPLEQKAKSGTVNKGASSLNTTATLEDGDAEDVEEDEVGEEEVEGSDIAAEEEVEGEEEEAAEEAEEEAF